MTTGPSRCIILQAAIVFIGFFSPIQQIFIAQKPLFVIAHYTDTLEIIPRTTRIIVLSTEKLIVFTPILTAVPAACQVLF